MLVMVFLWRKIMRVIKRALKTMVGLPIAILWDIWFYIIKNLYEISKIIDKKGDYWLSKWMED